MRGGLFQREEKLERFVREGGGKRRLALTRPTPGSPASKADICILIHLSNKFLKFCHAAA